MLLLATAFVEITLAVTAVGLLTLGLFIPRTSAETLIPRLAFVVVVLLLGVALWMQATESAEPTLVFSSHFRLDAYALYIKILILAAVACLLLIGQSFVQSETMASMRRFEYAVIILLAALGMTIMISATNLLSMYVGLELQSLSLYIGAAFRRDNLRSSEAGLKYFMLGAVSSGILLFGCSLIYGGTATIDFHEIAQTLAADTESNTLVSLGLVLTICALAFKISAVPFHMWTPDVYEGAPTPITTFLATAAKISALGVFIRLLVEGFLPMIDDWQPILVLLSVFSMILGAFAAIAQNNIKRFMAYASIAHIGYTLIGFATATPEGIRAVLLYMTIYMVMTLGMFALILAMRREEKITESIESLSGLSRTDAKSALAFSVLLFSMAGLPPFAGFFAKFYIFLAALRGDLAWLAIVGAVSSVVSAYYYIRIVKIMYFDEPQRPFVLQGRANRFVLYLSAAGVLVFTLSPSVVTMPVEHAISVLFLR